METNSMTFSISDQEKGLHLELINFLLRVNRESEDHSVEFLVKQEDEFVIIEWIVNYHDYENHFQAIGDDECVMIEYRFPDNHFEYVFSEEEGKELLDEWLKENPGWEKGPYGAWYNKIENERLRKEFGLDKEGNE